MIVGASALGCVSIVGAERSIFSMKSMKQFGGPGMIFERHSFRVSASLFVDDELKISRYRPHVFILKRWDGLGLGTLWLDFLS